MTFAISEGTENGQDKQLNYGHRFLPGGFVAVTFIWYDHLNHTGLFEPVGTHKYHRRRSFGRATMMYGMQQMAAAGTEFATVAHFGHNKAA